MTRNLKIISGLVLFVFVAVHLTNLALGVFSLRVADAIRPWLMAPFANPVGGLLLITSMLLHMALGLQALYLRSTLRMSRHDTIQFVSAFLVPPLLIPHVWGLIAAKELLDISPTYLDLFKHFWVDSPLDGLRQVLLVVIIWVHGCTGLFTWLKLKPWWPKYSKFAYPLAVAIPVMALLGFVGGGNHILGSMAANQDMAQSNNYELNSEYRQSPSGQTKTSTEVPPNPTQLDPDSAEFKEARAFIDKTKWQMVIGYFALLALVLIARLLRVRTKGQLIEVRYADGQTLTRTVGPTLLELANMNDIPHANLCQGRGRCGTCRVEVIDSDCALDPPSKIEQATLARTGSAPNVRLACQLSPGPGVIRIRRLLPPNIQPADLFKYEHDTHSTEQPVLLTGTTQEKEA